MKGVFRGTILGLLLLLLSAALYTLHFAIYRDLHNIFYYMLMNIAFLPIEVLLVTLIIHRLLNEREKRSRLDRLNMVIGAFFSEVGTDLLAYFSDHDPCLEQLQEELIPTGEWTDQQFRQVSQRLKQYAYEVHTEAVDLEILRKYLLQKRGFLLNLLSNPNMQEHETFSDLFWAVFHLTDELIHREDVACLPGSDCQHLAGDIQRAYSMLVFEWLGYMKHLKEDYPHLFSLAMRLNPFDRNAALIVRHP